ncbi:L,D-transpeptidase family protein [Pseudovibrio ascidiaceicola]|uniref:L,D-transpeptidase family protein n=1 Tax=Pseudovibrio ascidiaceicola TaxID=285279 RepID=UPI003D36D844
MNIKQVTYSLAIATTALLHSTAISSALDIEKIKSSLEASIPNLCGSQLAAAAASLYRLNSLNIEDNERAILVNLASGKLVAYEGDLPVFKSPVLVGTPDTPTPELATKVKFIQLNPTWTVPESIVRKRGWRDRLATDPEYFVDSNFKISNNGKLSSPYDVFSDPPRSYKFVQMPGEDNALGRAKIGLHNAGAIFLHDTNTPEAFSDDRLGVSAGCVRVQYIRELVAWASGTSTTQISRSIDSGRTKNPHLNDDVQVVLGYWTAWPDSNGNLEFYEDIYNYDHSSGSCS